MGLKLQNALLVLGPASPAEYGFCEVLLAQTLFRFLSLLFLKKACMKSICNYHTVRHISTDTATVLSLCSDNSILLVLSFSCNDSTKGTLVPGSPHAKMQCYFTTNTRVSTIDSWHVQWIRGSVGSEDQLDQRTTQSLLQGHQADPVSFELHLGWVSVRAPHFSWVILFQTSAAMRAEGNIYT